MGDIERKGTPWPRELWWCEACDQVAVEDPCEFCGEPVRRTKVVPLTDHQGAVSREDADAALVAWDAFRADNDLDGLIGFEAACDALNALRGR